MSESDLKKTPLHPLHQELGAKLVPFAGYEMPVQYPLGIMKEHLHTRAEAGLFDVSHMGQAILSGAEPAASLEELVPGELQALKVGRMRYTLLMNDRGGIRDDLMATRLDNETFYLVVNAACKDADFAYMQASIGGETSLDIQDQHALLALQGPKAGVVLTRHAPACSEMAFMSMAQMEVAGHACRVSRSGYTGEDGFEISVAAEEAEDLARLLLAEDEVEAIGLGARDSLRLEAGLCLYGHDIDETTTPVEADLVWALGKRRREEGGYPGHETVARQLADGPSRKRVGLKPEGRAPVREGAELLAEDGTVLGKVTSGGFGPSVQGPIAMGYLAASHAAFGTKINAIVRDKPIACTVTALPFIETRYYKKPT